MLSSFYGRSLLENEVRRTLEDKDLWPDQLKPQPAFVDDRCMRCGSSRKEDKAYIPCSCSDKCYYCTACLQMGQVKSCSKLWTYEEANVFEEVEGEILTWKGTLSDQQGLASQDIVHAVNHHETRLIWAVAGAGKTEMLFEGIAEAVRLGYRICLASPRVDVCLELAPRIKAAFEHVSQIVLYGDMEEVYHYTQIVIATTHQFMRFEAAFDFLIIDEIDAFPFYQNDQLYFAAEKARKKESALIYLTATPDKKLLEAVKRKKLLASILPARYHGYPLPVPKMYWAGNWQKELLEKPEKSPIIKQMQKMLANNRRFLIFAPNIKWMEKFEKVLLGIFPEKRFTSVSSVDDERKKKVMAMRKEEVDFLITTTILERGVTFKNIDVIVIGAEDRTFTEAALVQISGRVGRNSDYPTGDIYFYHNGKSLAMKKALKQIKTMNAMAKKRGLLHG